MTSPGSTSRDAIYGDAAHAVSQIVDGCNQYLTRVSEARERRLSTHPEFEPALRDLRAVIALVAEHAGGAYKLPIAAELATAMYADEPQLRVVASELRSAQS
jgi:hypothetical protein